MKAVLISIQPKWCELIANGKKTIEVRKTAPMLNTPFKVYIYETKDKKYDGIGVHRENGRDFIHNGGKVIGEFLCVVIITDKAYGRDKTFNTWAGMSEADAVAYCQHKEVYGWGIAYLKIYDKPKELAEFSKYGFNEPVPLKRPPQSWMYVEDGICP